MKIKLIKLLTKLIQNITKKIEQLTEKQTKVIVYTAIILGLIGPIYLWIKFTIWCIRYAIGLF